MWTITGTFTTNYPVKLPAMAIRATSLTGALREFARQARKNGVLWRRRSGVLTLRIQRQSSKGGAE